MGTGNVTAIGRRQHWWWAVVPAPFGQLWGFINPFGKTRLANVNIHQSIKPRCGDESVSQIWSKGKKQQNGTTPCFMMKNKKGKPLKIIEESDKIHAHPIQLPSNSHHQPEEFGLGQFPETEPQKKHHDTSHFSWMMWFWVKTRKPNKLYIAGYWNKYE